MKKILLLTAVLLIGIFGLGCPPAADTNVNNAATPEATVEATPEATPEATAEASPEASPADGEKKDGEAEKTDEAAKPAS